VHIVQRALTCAEYLRWVSWSWRMGFRSRS